MHLFKCKSLEKARLSVSTCVRSVSLANVSRLYLKTCQTDMRVVSIFSSLTYFKHLSWYENCMIILAYKQIDLLMSRYCTVLYKSDPQYCNCPYTSRHPVCLRTPSLSQPKQLVPHEADCGVVRINATMCVCKCIYEPVRARVCVSMRGYVYITE